MATSPDEKKIDRKSIKTSLYDRYNALQNAGGAFDAYAATTNTSVLGTQAPFGFTQKSVDWTIRPGFEPKITGVIGGASQPGENFNDKALNYGDKINGGIKTDGVNKISTNWNGQSSLQDVKYTTDSGFKLKMPQGITQFKDAVGENSKQLSIYMKGFNNTKYTNGKFTR
jgi:hypothetical protein